MEFIANTPPYKIPLIPNADILKMSDEVLSRPDIPIKIYEDIFRVRVAEMDWDIGLNVYEPEDGTKIPTNDKGKKIGFFILHGGNSDFRVMDPLGKILAGKFGYKTAIMTYPGRLNLLDESRKWSGEAMFPNSIDLDAIEYVRTPMWSKECVITRDQYDIRLDKSKRDVYGTMIFAHAKKGTEFYYRLAAWPWAFDEAMKTACRRQFPENDFVIYTHGHSTGGPFSFILSQRVPNVEGIVGVENTPFGRIFSKMINVSWNDMPFNELRLVCWRNYAKYHGDIVLKNEGPKALMRLASIMEEVFEKYKKMEDRPNFRVESLIHHNGVVPLEQAARAIAERLKMNSDETEALVKQYVNYTYELSGPGVKPVPPYLNVITRLTRNHDPSFYINVVLPMFAAMKPAPKVCVVQVEAGQHSYYFESEGLPKGLFPIMAKFANEAITGGFFSV